MHIRRATLQDVALLAQLNTPIQQLHADAIPTYFKAPNAHDPELHAFYAERLASAEWVGYIAEDADEPMGYILCLIRRAPENPFQYAQTSVLIDQLSVNPTSQRQGCGRALTQAAFDLAREVNATQVILNVWTFNTTAHAFYEALGFEDIGAKMQVTLQTAS